MCTQFCVACKEREFLQTVLSAAASRSRPPRKRCVHACVTWRGPCVSLCFRKRNRAGPSQASLRGQVESLGGHKTTLLDVAGIRPNQALDLLERSLPDDEGARESWRARARVAAVMGSCPRSLKSFKSGLKHWLRFIAITYGEESAGSAAFPPRLDDVLAWSNTFRCVCSPFPSVVCTVHVQGVSAHLRTTWGMCVRHAMPWDTNPRRWVTRPSGAAWLP